MQTEVRLLFFSGRSVVSRIIRFRTWSKWSHVAILVSHGDTTLLLESNPGGVTVTGDVQEIYNQIQEAYVLTLRPELAELLDGQAMIDFMRKQKGKKYDYPAAFGFLFRAKETRISKGLWFCSEIVFQTVLEGGLALLERVDAYKVSPGLLYMSPLMTHRFGG